MQMWMASYKGHLTNGSFPVYLRAPFYSSEMVRPCPLGVFCDKREKNRDTIGNLAERSSPHHNASIQVSKKSNHNPDLR